MSVYLGIDLGGTKIAAAVVNVRTGAIAGRRTVPTEGQSPPEDVLARTARLARDVCAAAGLALRDVAGVGLGVPGLFDLASGETQFLPNLRDGWRGVPAGSTLSAALGLPVRLINDARAFVLAEAIFGAGRGMPTVVGLTLGTGVGGGIVIGGRLHLGLDGTAGEIGHHTIDREGAPCGCGNRGCLETFAGGPAISARGASALREGRAPRLAALAGGDPARVTPDLVRRAAEEGDEAAQAVLAHAGSALGVGIANMITVLSPDRVILGGGVALLGEWLLGPARAEVLRRCHVTPLERVQIVPAALGGDAGIIGAAVWASQMASI